MQTSKEQVDQLNAAQAAFVKLSYSDSDSVRKAVFAEVSKQPKCYLSLNPKNSKEGRAVLSGIPNSCKYYPTSEALLHVENLCKKCNLDFFEGLAWDGSIRKWILI